MAYFRHYALALTSACLGARIAATQESGSHGVVDPFLANHPEMSPRHNPLAPLLSPAGAAQDVAVKLDDGEHVSVKREGAAEVQPKSEVHQNLPFLARNGIYGVGTLFCGLLVLLAALSNLGHVQWMLHEKDADSSVKVRGDYPRALVAFWFGAGLLMSGWFSLAKSMYSTAAPGNRRPPPIRGLFFTVLALIMISALPKSTEQDLTDLFSDISASIPLGLGLAGIVLLLVTSTQRLRYKLYEWVRVHEAEIEAIFRQELESEHAKQSPDSPQDEEPQPQAGGSRVKGR